MNRIILALALLAGSSGCAHVLSHEALDRVDHDITFTAVKADPATHLGQTLVLGGLIIAVETEHVGTTLEIMRYTLDHWGEPRRADEISGRFLARVERFLDPELYKSGRFVTLTGTVAGQESREVSGIPYTYPLFTIGEIYLWQQPLGVYSAPMQGYFYYSYPYYYSPYYYDPWWSSGPYYWSRPYYYQSRPPYREDKPSGGWSGPQQHKRDR